MSNMKLGRLIGLLLAATFLVSEVYSEELPAGWRFPSESDLKGDFIRESSTEKFIEIEADLNGDGYLDKAYLVKSTTFSGQALLVKLSQNKKYEWTVLDHINWGEQYPNVPLAMGIGVLKPGQFETACGKGYWECTEEEQPMVSISHPGIDYFKWGSANSVFYWDSNVKAFKRVWLSD